MNISLSPLAPENWSRETDSAVPSRVILPIPHTIYRLKLLIVLTLLAGFLPSSAAASIYLFYTAIRHRVSPSLSGHAIAYRWWSLRESTGTRPVVLQALIVPVTGATFISPWTNQCTVQGKGTYCLEKSWV